MVWMRLRWIAASARVAFYLRVNCTSSPVLDWPLTLVPADVGGVLADSELPSDPVALGGGVVIDAVRSVQG